MSAERTNVLRVPRCSASDRGACSSGPLSCWRLSGGSTRAPGDSRVTRVQVNLLPHPADSLDGPCSEAGAPALPVTSPLLPGPPRSFRSPHESSTQISTVKGLTTVHTAQQRDGCEPREHVLLRPRHLSWPSPGTAGSLPLPQTCTRGPWGTHATYHQQNIPARQGQY